MDEPPWSPALLEQIAEGKQLWLTHDQDDTDLLLRPDAGDLPALCIPTHCLDWLTPELTKPLTRIIVVQRADTVGDGFYAAYGLKVKAQLETVGWRGTLTRVVLPELPTPTLAHLWAYVQEDRERFQLELVNWQQAGITERIRGTRRRSPPKRQAKALRPIIVSAEEIEAQPIQWLWPPYIPRGMVVMLDGDPGLGKGLMLIQIATNLSRSWPFLDQVGTPTVAADVDGPQSTLILSAEDSLAHVMIPRLERAGADRRYIKFLTGWLGPEAEERAFTFQHMPVLTQAIEQVKPVLVILDPLVAYLGDIDMYKATQTRPLMAALRAVAERYDCTILGVRHPGKSDQGGRLMYRGQGNADVIGAARSGLWVQPHPTHPDTETILLQSKSNVGKLGRTVIFTREDGNFTWKGVSRLSEGMLTGKGPDPWFTLEAFFWLEEYMRPGLAYKVADIEKEAEARGIGKKPLASAKRDLRINSKQVHGGWTWTLPPLTS